MKVLVLLISTLALITTAQADFSYKVTRKVTGGALAQVDSIAKIPQVSRHYLKGHKIAVANEFSVQIFDFDARTITYLYQANKKYIVRNLSDLNADKKAGMIDAKTDAKKTGQKKVVNGFSADELLMTVEIANPQFRETDKMKIEVEIWFSNGVPGGAELRDFYRINTDKLPWAAIGGLEAGIPLLLPAALDAYVSCFDWSGCSGNPDVQGAVAGLRGTIASMEGIPVAQVVRVTAPVGAFWIPFMKGPSGSTGKLIEMTMESSDFSTNAISNSIFAIPEGYTNGPPAGFSFRPPDRKPGK